ncbi:tyrosine-type recombinase/integrase [Aliiruegeria lutimaris]|uniref:Integrase n=1 Tax=Aliiruegeria lutimaris TaxID=571298 RepID=A0A1G8UZ08_9RHOB|nr:site-specific integrase [Aliiruegeria lutimaris]SDJ58180.1 Integrase [Aliiruegeria lutimaris]
MPKIAKEMTALDLKRLKYPLEEMQSRRKEGDNRPLPPVVQFAGGVAGLQVQITASGSKSWLLRTTIAGKRRSVGLGSYPEVSLAEARDRAREMKKLILDGVDPIEERKKKAKAVRLEQRRGLTYSEAIDGWMKIHKSKSEKNRQLTRNRLRTYSEEAGLGKLRVGDIDKHMVKDVLDPIWATKTSTATRLREDMKRVFAWAIGNDHMAGPNPAEWVGNLEFMMEAPDTRKEHYPAVPVNEAPRWMQELRKRDGNGSRALEFLVLTAARSGEVRGARWSEIDLEEGLWTIPASRMKMGREHRVPLSSDAVGLLKSMNGDGSGFVFSAVRGGELSNMTLSAAMKRIHADDEKGFVDGTTGRPAVPHGWRSTFRQWTAERGFARDMAEIALAHDVGSEVERSYQRSDMLERRRAMMEEWAAHLLGTVAGGEVVPLH